MHNAAVEKIGNGDKSDVWVRAHVQAYTPTQTNKIIHLPGSDAYGFTLYSPSLDETRDRAAHYANHGPVALLVAKAAGRRCCVEAAGMNGAIGVHNNSTETSFALRDVRGACGWLILRGAGR